MARLPAPGELARLAWKDVHFDRDLALLWTHNTRRIGKPTVISLIPKFETPFLWLHVRRKDSRVIHNSCGRPWTRHTIAKQMAKAREKCGLPADVVPYTVLHRVATNAILRTGDLKMTSLLLGHGGPQQFHLQSLRYA